jgi:hypothetical protein
MQTFAEEDGVDDRGAKEESLSYDATFKVKELSCRTIYYMLIL